MFYLSLFLSTFLLLILSYLILPTWFLGKISSKASGLTLSTAAMIDVIHCLDEMFFFSFFADKQMTLQENHFSTIWSWSLPFIHSSILSDRMPCMYVVGWENSTGCVSFRKGFHSAWTSLNSWIQQEIFR